MIILVSFTFSLSHSPARKTFEFCSSNFLIPQRYPNKNTQRLLSFPIMSSPDLDYESGSDVSDLDPESDILLPVQTRIEGQLRRNLEELTLNLRETSNEAAMVKQRREDCGVDLYNVQQHLAKLQESLEKGHDNFQAIQKLREEKEAERAQLTAQSEAAQKVIQDMDKKYLKFQTELDKLNETIRKVEQFNEQIQSEIQVERRAAYVAESNVVKMEKAKQRQDLLVDGLNERIRTLTEQQAALSAQLAAQKEETKVARETLNEALSEMESINLEKKQFVQQWKTSIMGMQRRDDAVRKTEEALTKQKEELQALDNEMIGYRQNIKLAQAENAKLSSILSKTENEVGILEKQIDSMLEKKEKATHRYGVLKKALEQADADKKSIDAEIRDITAEISGITKKSQKAAKDVIDMESKVMETLSKQTTLKKGSLAALQDIERMKNAIHDKELQVTQMENELARIRVDTLQTESHNEVLKQTVGELEKELQSRDSLIERMQVDIRRKHDEIERKQKQLDALNRQFDAIIAAQGSDEGEHVGPLEATINNLSKSITQKSSENDLLQREWIKLQTELVSSKNYNTQLEESIQELKSQCIILTQKRARLLQRTKAEREDIALLENNTQKMHVEMTKLNTLLTKNTKAQQAAANDAYLIENDLVKRLQELKRDALQLEKKIEDIRNAKADILAEILDAERDVMFWEKKIQIAKETEMALDPNIGKDEINRMKREIYIMEQRLGNIQREQKHKIESMQKLIEHRDVLRTKGQAIQAATKNDQKGVTKATVGKDNARLAAELNQKKQEAQEKERQIKASLANTEQAANDVERAAADIQKAQDDLANVERQIDLRNQERHLILDEKARKQRTLQRIRDAQNGHYKLSLAPEEAEQEKRDLENKKRALVVVIEQLSNQYPDMRSELEQIVKSI